MLRVLHGVLLVGFCLNLWLALAYMISRMNVGGEPPLNRWALLTYVLLIAAPAATFVPLARWLRALYYDVEAISGWAVFGYVVTFTSPGEALSRGQFLMFLLPLTVVIATLMALVAFAFGARMHPDRSRGETFLQARRQGYLAGIVIVVLILLRAFGVLSPFNGFLLVTIAILVEALMQARFGMQPLSQRR